MALTAKFSRSVEPLRLARKYCLVASAWIVGSDLLLTWRDGKSFQEASTSILKGLAFVAVTAALLYFFARRMQDRLIAESNNREDELRQANVRLERVKSLHAVLARAHQAALTANSEQSLCQEISQALISIAGLRFTWCAWVDESTLLIKPTVWAGDAPGFLEGPAFSVDPDHPNGQCPLCRAIRESRAVVCHNLSLELAAGAHLDLAAKYNFRSSISAPFTTRGKRGAITAYSGENDFFDPEITSLVLQLASDLAHGIETIAARNERSHLMERVSASEANHRALFENDYVVMLLVDPATGLIEDANPAAARFYGRPRQSLVGSSMGDINTASPENLAEALRKAGATHQAEFLFRHRLADGSIRDVEVHAGPVIIDGRKLVYSIVLDVTERLAAQRALAEALSLNKVALDASPLGMVIHAADGSVSRANAAAARILDLAPAELLAQTLHGNSLWAKFGLLEIAQNAIATGQPQETECDLILKDGKSVHLSATFNAFQFQNEQRLLTTLEDITDRRRSLARLHLLETAIQAAPNAIIITDPLGNIEWANPAFTALTGYPLEKAIGRTPALLRSGRQDSAFYENLWNTISHGKTWSGELQNQRADGSIYWERMVVAPVVSPNGTILHYVAIKQDIAAEKEMEQQVARTQRLESIGLLAGGIAHDLNNVLSPILMATDLFKMRYTDPADHARLDLIHKSAERGASIVRQVLTFARGVDGERMLLQPHHIIKEVCNLLDETIPRNIEIHRNIDDKLPSITGDLTQLHQILVNLGVNARDSMANGGTITFGATRELVTTPRVTGSGLPLAAGEYVVLSVRDTGTGIPAKVIEHMFEPFFTTKERGKGTGLGLSTVLGLVRSHGGGLEVSSTVGEGTEFRIFFPAAPDPDAVPEHTRFHPEVHGDGRCILVVDDETPIRTIIGLALENHGFTHVDAGDGVAALELFNREPARFAAIILDRMMPRMGGNEVARRIKAVRPDLPIVLMSGLLSEHRMADAAAAPEQFAGDLVLHKPFSQDDLLNALATLFAPGSPDAQRHS